MLRIGFLPLICPTRRTATSTQSLASLQKMKMEFCGCLRQNLIDLETSDFFFFFDSLLKQCKAVQ